MQHWQLAHYVSKGDKGPLHRHSVPGTPNLLRMVRKVSIASRHFLVDGFPDFEFNDREAGVAMPLASSWHRKLLSVPGRRCRLSLYPSSAISPPVSGHDSHPVPYLCHAMRCCPISYCAKTTPYHGSPEQSVAYPFEGSRLCQ